MPSFPELPPKSDLEQWVENTMLSASSKAKFLVSSEELATKYNLGIHPTRCSGKTIATILKRLGYKKLDKKAKLYDGSRRGLFVPTSEIEKYAEMSETELGKAYGDQGIG